MNKVHLSGEVTESKIAYAANSSKYINFVVEDKDKYRDKKTNEVKSWSTRIKCTYEVLDNTDIQIGDYVVIDGKITVKGSETPRGKVWITEVRCNDVKVFNKGTAKYSSENELF